MILTYMMFYGETAQEMFGVNTGDLALTDWARKLGLNTANFDAIKNATGEDYNAAMDGIVDALKNNTFPDGSTLNYDVKTGDDPAAVASSFGAKYYGTSLFYLSNNNLRLYFIKDENSSGFNPANYQGNQSNYYYYVENKGKDGKGIAPAEIFDQQTFTVGGTTFKYSPFDYAKAVVNSSAPQVHKTLAYSLTLYGFFAKIYFAVYNNP